MSPRLIVTGLFTTVFAGLALSSSVFAGGIDVTPGSASVAPGEVIEFEVDPDQGCWRPNNNAVATPVYTWTITDSSATVVAGPTNVLGTEFEGGLLTVSVNAPQNPGTYTFNWTAINECAPPEDEDRTASFVVTGTPTTDGTTPTSSEVAGPTPGAALPDTGGTTNGLLWATLIALLMGGGAVAVAARRN